MFFNSSMSRRSAAIVPVVLAAVSFSAYGQETTGSMQGAIKDPSGASVGHAHVVLTGDKLIGKKEVDTDSSGFYRFANLLPGRYTITVNAAGFAETKQENIVINVGSLPTINVTVAVGSSNTVVEVSATENPQIDITESRVQTTVSAEQLVFEPHGLSFQSVIGFAPGANLEPLQNGYSINGAATSENSYLLDGINTQSLITGTSQANAPVEFLDQVQVKTSGIEAAYGGALGGVVEASQRKGGNSWHGSIWNYYLSSGLDANPVSTIRYNPQASNPTGRADIATQYYTPTKDHYRELRPGVVAAGYIVKDRLWTTLGYQPDIYALRRTVNFNAANCKGTNACTGPYTFTQDWQRQYALGRLDGKITERLRAFGAWTYQYYRISGSSLPNADSINSLYNTTSPNNPLNYTHGIGNVQPNLLITSGLDETITQSMVGTTKFGYFYQNYQDRGLPTGIRYYYQGSSLGMKALDGTVVSTTAGGGNQATGFDSLGSNSTYLANQQKTFTFSQDLNVFKKGFFGLHNLQGGYVFTHTFHNENLAYNTGLVYLYPNASYSPISSYVSNCYAIEAANVQKYGKTDYDKAGNPITTTNNASCRGNYGYAVIREYGTIGSATSNQNGFYIQDKATFRNRLTVNAGVRLEKEYLPSYDQYATGINFGFGDKISPRLGAAYDVLGNGKLKVSGMYGVFYDVMKLNLAIDSFGGAYWHNCTYAWDTLDYSTINPQRGADGHYCSGTGGANFATGSAPANLRFMENQNYRIPANDPTAGAAVDPNLKPYRDHQAQLSAAYAITPLDSIEATYVRTRLDHAIEDAGLLGPEGEYFLIVNPGEGVDYQPVAGCTTCQIQPKAARNYDGIDFRYVHHSRRGFSYSADYNYSHLRGNYSGLTSSDLADGGGARNSANDNRSFDEPYFQFNAHGKSANGLLPTDRPNRFKLDGFYAHNYFHRFNTGIGIFQQIYSGTPLSTYLDVAQTAGSYPVYVEGRGKWVDITANADGSLNFGKVYTKRTPAYIQTDANFTTDFAVSDQHEGWRLGFEWQASNLFNQKAATIINSHANTSNRANNFITPAGYKDASGNLNYGVLENGYDYQALANTSAGTNGSSLGGMVIANTYGQAGGSYGGLNGFQAGRSMRMKVKFNF